MGSTVSALCSCGLRLDEIPIGGGIASHSYLCLFPAYCRSCRSLQVVNMFTAINSSDAKSSGFFSRFRRRRKPEASRGPLLCPGCKSPEISAYDSPELINSKGPVVASWNTENQLGRILELTGGKYLCPQCREFNLTFQAGSRLWD